MQRTDLIGFHEPRGLLTAVRISHRLRGVRNVSPQETITKGERGPVYQKANQVILN